MLDLHIVHDRWGSSSDPSLNGHLHYPNDLDGPLNKTATEQLIKYDNTTLTTMIVPPTLSPLAAIPSTSGRLHWAMYAVMVIR